MLCIDAAFVALMNALSAAPEEIPHSKTRISDDEVVVPQMPVSEAAKVSMKNRVAAVFSGYNPARHRLVLLNPHASELLPQRRWPRGHFAMLAQRVLDPWGNPVILITGAPSEVVEAEKLKTLVSHPRIADFAARCELIELPTLYGIAEVMVTNDSSPADFALVTRMPAIVFFRPETPALYGSLGSGEAISAGLARSPCVSAANHRKSACRDPVCMRAISPARVFDSVRAVLN